MKKIEIQKILTLIFIFLGVEIWSYLAYSLEMVALPIFLFLSLIFLALTIYSLPLGLYIIISDLIVNSMGHLFFIDIFSQKISIRTIFWLTILVVFLFNFIRQIIKDKKESLYLQRIINFKAKKYFIILAIFVLISLIIAVSSQRSLANIFSDFNAWLFFLLLFPILAIYDDNNAKQKSDLKIMFLAAGTWLVIKSFFILAVFAQELSISPEVYTWLRKTLVAEVTPTLSGWPRVFLQSHIFAAAFYLFFFWLNNKYTQSKNLFTGFFKTKKIVILLISSLLFSLIIFSFSRSIWLGLFFALAISLIYIWKNEGFKKFWQTSLWTLFTVILGFLFIFLVVWFPYFNFNKQVAGEFKDSFSSRIVYNSSDSATVSRWSLLPVLWEEIKERPLFGKGFGASVSYISSDPRVLEKYPNGEYTTSAFEWGYLDIWLKTGFFGLISYLILLFYLIIKGIRSNDKIKVAFSVILIFLAITHAFTPYLNHPLGIGILLLSSCFICKNEI